MVQNRESLSMTSNPTEPLGMYDPLTELYNKPLFIQVMESLLSISMRQHMPVSLVIVSIDNYEDYYDEYSLSDTKNLLKEGAEIIKSLSRDSDVLAHFEEEKFALLLYNCSNKSASIPIERLRHNLEENLIIGEEKVTVTMGTSTFGEEHNAGRGKQLREISDDLVTTALLSLNNLSNYKSLNNTPL